MRDNQNNQLIQKQLQWTEPSMSSNSHFPKNATTVVTPNFPFYLTTAILVLFLNFPASLLAVKQDAVELSKAQIVNQTEIGPMSCGPCALINSYLVAEASKPLSNLDGQSNLDKVRAFIADYGSAASIPYSRARTAYSRDNGACDVDLEAMIKRFSKDNQLPVPDGQYVARKKDESEADFLSRVQRLMASSIENGFHPLLSIRAMAAEYDEVKKKHVWNSKSGHWIAVHKVGELGNESLGFSVDFSDSLSGKLKTGMVFSEVTRKAIVPMSFKVNKAGKAIWEWVPNSQTLSLFSPGMPLGTRRAKWNERTFIAIRYLIYNPSKSRNRRNLRRTRGLEPGGS